MSKISPNIKFGTCSWNYDSWVGLVYPTKMDRAVQYLPYYSQEFPTAEIDSWFYRIPSETDVREYKDAVPSDFRFTCKVPRQISLTHHRQRKKNQPLQKNRDFLSVSVFEEFVFLVEPLVDQIDALMFEFEYLNKQKMESVDQFVELFSEFLAKLPEGLPYAVETRNSNYLKTPYYKMVADNKLIHVFSEKIYMPHIYEVYPEIEEHLRSEKSVVRLLGGDRKEIEKKTNGQWNEIVEAKDDLDKITGMIKKLSGKMEVTVNVNNHYEGSAPKTIERLMDICYP